MQKNMKLGNMKQSSRSSNDSFHLTFGRRQSVHIGESSLRARTGNSVKSLTAAVLRTSLHSACIDFCNVNNTQNAAHDVTAAVIKFSLIFGKK